MCVYDMSVCMHACIGAYVFRGTHKWKFVVDVGSLLGLLSTLYIEAEAFPQTYRSPTQLASLADHLVLRVPCLCPETLELPVGLHTHPAFMGIQGIQTLVYTLATCVVSASTSEQSSQSHK